MNEDKEVTLSEDMVGLPANARVDREAGVLHDVLLLGPVSKDGAIYPEAVRRASLPLIIGSKVNLSHNTSPGRVKYGPYTPVPPTSHDRRIGKIIAAHDTEDGVRGDIKVLKSHPFTATLMESAELMPDLFGLSIQAAGIIGETKDDQGRHVVERITRVSSVDIVTDPGTAKSLFEEAVGKEEEPKSAEMAYVEACVVAATHAVMDALEGKSTPEEAAKMIKEHLKHHLKTYGGKEDGGEEEKEESAAEEQLRHLQAEKDARILCESLAVDPTQEIVQLLVDLPDQITREKHLKYMKKMSVVKINTGKKEHTQLLNEKPSSINILRGEYY